MNFEMVLRNRRHKANGGTIHGWIVLIYFTLMGAYVEGNPIQDENNKPGTSAWQLSNPSTQGEIEGYASLTSIDRGGFINLYVSTTDPSYSIEVFRMGWYQGLGARHVAGPVTRPGILQTIPTPDPTTGLVECHWLNPYVLPVPFNASDPTDWCSGIYLAKLTGSPSGKQSYIIFVVRDDARPSDFLFQSSVTTAAAYNGWGGKSLYDYMSNNNVPATKVSFDRPYKRFSDLPDPGSFGVGAGEFLVILGGGGPSAWEYNMVRFLEREGMDVTYCTNIDTHAYPNLLLSHRAFLSIGHDEYWSWEMRANVESARDQGVGLGFFSANTCYWQIRLEPNSSGAPNRTVVCYKYKPDVFTEDPLWQTADHTHVTVWWRDAAAANRPEGMLMGVQSAGSCCLYGESCVIFDASHWICHGARVHSNDLLPGLVGNEVDSLYTGPGAPANVAMIAHSPWPYNPFFSDFTVYTVPSGANVVATGTFQWSFGLDDFGADASVGPVVRPSWLSPAALQMTRNVLSHFIGAKWVNFGYNGTETGTITQPFNTLGEAVDAMPTGGCVVMRPGSSTETLTISRAMTLEVSSGVVSIGQ